MSFQNIKGQDRSLKLLKGYIERGNLQGGYLFTGPKGVGKKLAAKEVAKALNCLQNNFNACDRCASCKKIDSNGHPDVHILGPGDSEIKIDHIRQFKKAVWLKPYEGKKKVFIIDDAHRFNAEASNALLKILEEPTADTLIILVSDKPTLLFKTIISRCKILKFSAFNRIELKGIFKKDYQLDNSTAHFLAYFSEGRIGLALRLKDTDILRRKNAIINKFCFSARVNLENSQIQDKKEISEYLNILAAWFRDMYLIKVGMPHLELINFDRMNDLLKTMNRFSFPELNEVLDTISDSSLFLEQNINLKLLLSNLKVQIWKTQSL